MPRPKYVVGYQGTPLQYVDASTAVAICGNCFCLYSLTGGLNSHLMWGPGAGLQTSTFHPYESLLAFAEKGLQPMVHILQMRNENKEFAILADVGELEIIVLAFSLISWQFLTISGEPDFRVILWDLDPNKGATKMIEGTLDNAVKFASFNPISNERICVSGNGHLSIWEYNQSFHVITWKEYILECQTYQPHCHCWASDGKIIYAGCMDGEVLSFDVKKPYPRHDTTKDKVHIIVECKLLFKIENCEQVVDLCIGQNHMVIIGNNGSCYWLGFPIRVKKIKPVEEACEKKGRAKKAQKIEVVVDEWEPIDPNDFRVVDEIHLTIGMITSTQYRKDEKQLLLGTSNGIITTIEIDNVSIQTLIATKAKRLETSNRLVKVMWQSQFHNGPIQAISTIKNGTLLITCGKDGTMRIWSSDWGKEISCQTFKSSQLCLCILSDNDGYVISGSNNGYLNIVQVEKSGLSSIVVQIKLHTQSLNQIIYSTNYSKLLVGSKIDGRLFFLHNSSTLFNNFQLIGFIDLLNPIIALAFETKTSTGDYNLNVLVSLARGEIVMLNVPIQKRLDDELQFQHDELQKKSFIVGTPLNAIATSKYYAQKERTEKRIIWGLGQNKNLLQYRLPEVLSQWTGPKGYPIAPHFNIIAHQKAGFALVLLHQEKVIISGGMDGSLQIQTNALDSTKEPNKTLDLQMYDFYTSAIECVAANKGIIFTGGENGVFFCIDCSEVGLQYEKNAQSIQPTKSLVLSNNPPKDEKQLTLVEEYNHNIETRYLALGDLHRKKVHDIIDKFRGTYQGIYEKNNEAPPLEKLTPLEMIVDIDLEKKLHLIMEEKILVASEEIRISNLNKDILCERVNEECWNMMVEPGLAVWPFEKGFQVWNFPLLNMPTYNLKTALLGKLYRHIEMYEHHYMKVLQKELVNIAAKKTAEKAAKEVADLATQQAEIDATNALVFGPPLGLVSELEMDVASEASYRSEGSSRSNAFSYSNRTNIIQGSNRNSMVQQESIWGSIQGSMVGESGHGVDNQDAATPKVPFELAPKLQFEYEPELEEEVDDEDLIVVENDPTSVFLYSPFELTTTRRKRIQRLLLYMVLKDIRVEFNKRLAAARATKISHISRIAQMKIRILDLHKILSIPGECPWPILNEAIDGMPNVFEVKKEEVLVQKYLNRAERDEANKIQKIEEEQERLQMENNAAERALMDMMGGKLEKKLEVVTKQEEITRPKWMEGNPKKFTKEQHMEIKSFDNMLKEIKDAKEKKIKGQQAEQQTLRATIDDLCVMFDSDMEYLFQQRLIDEAKCVGIEETISRLSIAIETEEVLEEKKEANLNKHMDHLKALKAVSIASFNNFKKEVDAFEHRYSNAMNEDRNLDRNFRKDFIDTGDAINILYKKFKERPKKKKDGGQQIVAAISVKKKSRTPLKQTPQSSRSPSSNPSQNPSRRASSINQRTLVGIDSVEAPIDPFLERPQEVIPEQWKRLLVARGKKMAQEEEIRQLTAIINTMGSFLTQLTETDESNRKAIEKCLRSLAEFRDNWDRQRKNLEFVLNLKMQSIGAILNPLQGDDEDVALVLRTLIEDFNKVVLFEADTKIEMMLAAKLLKAQNHGVEWEITKNHVRQLHVTEKIHALQSLCVTKATQQVIKTGEDPTIASESLQIEKRYEHNAKMQAHRITEKARTYRLKQGKNNDIKLQNAKLLIKTRTLYLEQNFLNQLCSSRLAAIQKKQALEQRFQVVLKNAQLKNMVDQQYNQIQELAKELENTKNKILPLLPQVNMSGYKFSIQPLHSKIGREVLEEKKTYFRSIGLIHNG